MVKITKDLKKLVIARIEAYPNDIGLMMGMGKEYSKRDLIKNVKNETDLGKQIIEMQLEYLQDMVKGNIYTVLDK